MITDKQTEFLTGIAKVRQGEIIEGKNAMTTYPLYVVYEVVQSFSGNDDYTTGTSLFRDSDEIVKISDYTDREGDDLGKISFHDRFVTCCFTKKAAEEYIASDSHNLNKPRIYVHWVTDRNPELRGILEILGDKF